jgi:hypothetical protein
MKLSQALKLKKRMIGEINTIKNQIAKNNSHLSVNKPSYDAADLYIKWQEKLNKYIELKTLIIIANNPIQQLIFKLAEIKSTISFLNDLSIETGVRNNYFNAAASNSMVEYKSEIDDIMRDSLVKDLEKEIEHIQDQLDRFNYETEINFTE